MRRFRRELIVASMRAVPSSFFVATEGLSFVGESDGSEWFWGHTPAVFFWVFYVLRRQKILGASTKSILTPPRPLEPHRCPLKDSTAPSVLSLPGLGRLEMRFSKVLVLASWGLVSRAGFANGGITTAVDDDCVSAGDDPDYDFELALLDDFRLLWSVADSSVSVKVRAQTQPCADFVVARKRL